MKIKQLILFLVVVLGFSYASQAAKFDSFLADAPGDSDTITSFLTVPNAFQPNGTLMVVEFRPVYKNILSYKMSIYNRWGNLLFESGNPDVGWNGKHKGKFCPKGGYIYVITYTPLTNGVRGKEMTLRGVVSLLE